MKRPNFLSNERIFPFLYLRATRGACNPNLLVVITHASHVYGQQSFGPSITRNLIKRVLNICLVKQKILFFSSLTHEWTDTIRFSYNTAQFLLASSARFTVDLKKEITYDGINSKTENNNNNQINLIQYVQYKLLPKVPSPYNIKGLLYYTDQTA